MISQTSPGGREINQPTSNSTSERRKTYEKITHLAVHVSPTIFGFKKLDHYTQKHPKNTVG